MEILLLNIMTWTSDCIRSVLKIMARDGQLWQQCRKSWMCSILLAVPIFVSHPNCLPSACSRALFQPVFLWCTELLQAR